MEKENVNDTRLEEEGYFKVHESAATNLRAWLLAYGIGAPVLFLNNDTLCEALTKARCLKTVGVIFLIGVGLQVLIAILNKNIMWLCYCSIGSKELQKKPLYKISYWLSEQFWIDV